MDTLGFNEGKDFLLNAALHGGTGVTTVYFLISNTAIVANHLTAAVTLPQSTISVIDTTAFPSTGTFVIGNQTVTYTGKTGTTFTGCTGGTGIWPNNQIVIGSTGFQPTDVLATSGTGEITAWTGGSAYTRISQTVPLSANGIISFSQITWNTGTASDGPASAKSVVMATTSNNTGKAVYAWNLVANGVGTNFAANTQLQFTPNFFLQNIGGS